MSENETFNKDNQEILENDLSCAICRDVYINPIILNCSHSFCKFCVCRWLTKKTGCPQCRVAVTFHAENLALRNVINKMVQKSSSQFQINRTSCIQQRLRDEAQQEKEGTSRMIPKPECGSGVRQFFTDDISSIFPVTSRDTSRPSAAQESDFSDSEFGENYYAIALQDSAEEDDDDDDDWVEEVEVDSDDTDARHNSSFEVDSDSDSDSIRTVAESEDDEDMDDESYDDLDVTGGSGAEGDIEITSDSDEDDDDDNDDDDEVSSPSSDSDSDYIPSVNRRVFNSLPEFDSDDETESDDSTDEYEDESMDSDHYSDESNIEYGTSDESDGSFLMLDVDDGVSQRDLVFWFFD